MQEKIKEISELNIFKPRKKDIILHCHISLHGRSLEIILTVPLNRIIEEDIIKNRNLAKIKILSLISIIILIYRRIRCNFRTQRETG